jgi:hypothetical protein
MKKKKPLIKSGAFFTQEVKSLTGRTLPRLSSLRLIDGLGSSTAIQDPILKSVPSANGGICRSFYRVSAFHTAARGLQSKNNLWKRKSRTFVKIRP